MSAQEEPSANSSEPTGENKCAAVHLVLVNGTFDTSAGESSTTDHGFGAQIAGKAMRKANEIPPEDPSAGISLENTPEPVSTQTDDGQAETDDLWGQASVASEEETDPETNLWEKVPQPSHLRKLTKVYRLRIYGAMPRNHPRIGKLIRVRT